MEPNGNSASRSGLATTRTTTIRGHSNNEYVNKTFVMENTNGIKSVNIESISLGQLHTTPVELNDANRVDSQVDEPKCISWLRRLYARPASITARHRISAYYSLLLALFATTAMAASTFLVGLSAALSASDMAALAFTAQLLLSLPSTLCHRPSAATSLLGPPELRRLLATRGLCGALALLAAFFAIKMIGFAPTTTIRHSAPVITVLATRILLKTNRLNTSHAAALLLAILGVVCVIRPSALFRHYGNTTPLERSFEFICGTSLAIVCAVFASSTFVFVEKMAKSGHRVAISVVVFYLSAIGVVLAVGTSTLIYSLSAEARNFEATRHLIGKDVCIGVLAGVVGFFGQVCFGLAVSEEAENVAHISLLRAVVDVPVAFLLDYLYYELVPHWLGVVGAALVLCSVVVMHVYAWVVAVWERRAAAKDSDTFEIRL